MKNYDMLINKELSDFVSQTKRRESKVVYFAFPVAAHKYELEICDENLNPIKTAVKRLSDYYSGDAYLRSEEARDDEKRDDRRTKVGRIADDLGLKQELIECILQEIREEKKILDDMENSKQDESEVLAEKQSKGRKKAENVYILQDMLTKEVLAEVISEKYFDELKREVKNPHRYEPAISRSEYWNIIVLDSRETESRLYELDERLVEGVLRRKRGRNILKAISKGFPEKFYAVTCCFYAQNDKYSFRAANPFRAATDSLLEGLVQQWMKQDNEVGRKAKKELEKIKPAEDDEDVLTASKAGARLKKELEKNYANTDVSSKEVNRLGKLIMTYAYLRHLGERGEERNNAKRAEYEVDIARQDYLIALYTFLEILLPDCAKRNYQSSHVAIYNEETGFLKTDDDTGQLKRLATKVGFSCGEFIKRAKFKKSSVSDFRRMNESSKAAGWVYWNLLEAASEDKEHSKHPFYKIAEAYPRFLEDVFELHEYRNNAKHGAVSRLDNNYQDYYDTVLDVFSIIYNVCDVKIPDVKEIDTSEMADEFINAFRATFDEIIAHKEFASKTGQRRFNDIGELALFAGISFKRKDGEYYAKLSNLYDALLMEIINRTARERMFVDTEMIQRMLGEESNIIDGAIKILKRRCHQDGNVLKEREKYSNARSLLKRGSSLQKLSVRNKLLYSIYCLEDADDAYWNIEGFPTVFRDLCGEIERVEHGRGHNNQADFGKDRKELKRMYETALSNCKRIITILNIKE